MGITIKQSVGKCLTCGYEWWADDTGQNRPSRCPHCKKRYVDWKKNCSQKQLEAHMPEDLNAQIDSTEPRFIDKSNGQPVDTVDTAEQVVETNTDKPVDTVDTTENTETEKEQEMAKAEVKQEPEAAPEPKKEETMTQRKSQTRQTKPAVAHGRPRKQPEPETFFEEDFNLDDFPFNSAGTPHTPNREWQQAKAAAPKVNPMGIVFLIGAAVAVGGVIFFLRKNKGTGNKTNSQPSVQQVRIRPDTIEHPRMGGMVR